MVATERHRGHVRLGKLEARTDRKTLRLATYVKPAELPPIPSVVDNTAKVRSSWGVLLNDQLGDCVPVAAIHWRQAASAMTGHEVVGTNDLAERTYEAVGGYRPGDPSTDQGCVELDMMNYWRHVGLDGDRIEGFVRVDADNLLLVKAAIYLFGGVIAGLSLPRTAEDQFSARLPWRIKTRSGAGAPNSWGGHGVPLLGYSRYRIKTPTWGVLEEMTWPFWTFYGDEAWAPLWRGWIDQVSKKAPNGFDIDQLTADLSQFGKPA
jgi:hypothetical protein